MCASYSSEPRGHDEDGAYRSYRDYLKVDDIEGAVPKLNSRYTGARPDIMMKREFMEQQQISNKAQREYLKKINERSYYYNNHNHMPTYNSQINSPPVKVNKMVGKKQNDFALKLKGGNKEAVKIESFPRTYNPVYASAYMQEYASNSNPNNVPNMVPPSYLGSAEERELRSYLVE